MIPIFDLSNQQHVEEIFLASDCAWTDIRLVQESFEIFVGIVLLERMEDRERIKFSLWNFFSADSNELIFRFDNIDTHEDLGRLWSYLIIDECWSRSVSSLIGGHSANRGLRGDTHS